MKMRVITRMHGLNIVWINYIFRPYSDSEYWSEYGDIQRYWRSEYAWNTPSIQTVFRVWILFVKKSIAFSHLEGTAPVWISLRDNLFTSIYKLTWKNSFQKRIDVVLKNKKLRVKKLYKQIVPYTHVLRKFDCACSTFSKAKKTVYIWGPQENISQ